MAKIRVEGYSSLYRNSVGAIVNDNKSEYRLYLKRFKDRNAQVEEIREACREINTLKAEMLEIKQLLKDIGNKNGS